MTKNEPLNTRSMPAAKRQRLVSAAIRMKAENPKMKSHEIARALNVAPATAAYWLSPSYQKRQMESARAKRNGTGVVPYDEAKGLVEELRAAKETIARLTLDKRVLTDAIGILIRQKEEAQHDAE